MSAVTLLFLFLLFFLRTVVLLVLMPYNSTAILPRYLELRSLQNTNRKSYLASHTQLSAFCSSDWKCPKSPLASSDFGTRWLRNHVTNVFF